MLPYSELAVLSPETFAAPAIITRARAIDSQKVAERFNCKRCRE
jgi:hypothetical protein